LVTRRITQTVLSRRRLVGMGSVALIMTAPSPLAGEGDTIAYDIPHSGEGFVPQS
jgi:hypothetical protein